MNSFIDFYYSDDFHIYSAAIAYLLALYSMLNYFDVYDKHALYYATFFTLFGTWHVLQTL